jgi:hypothetical protein
MDNATSKILIQLASLTAGLAREIKHYRKHFGDIAPVPEVVSQAEQFQLPLRQLEIAVGQEENTTDQQISEALHKFLTTINKLLET